MSSSRGGFQAVTMMMMTTMMMMKVYGKSLLNFLLSVIWSLYRIHQSVAPWIREEEEEEEEEERQQ
jgi:hypothetical protein